MALIEVIAATPDHAAAVVCFLCEEAEYGFEEAFYANRWAENHAHARHADYSSSPPLLPTRPLVSPPQSEEATK